MCVPHSASGGSRAYEQPAINVTWAARGLPPLRRATIAAASVVHRGEQARVASSAGLRSGISQKSQEVACLEIKGSRQPLEHTLRQTAQRRECRRGRFAQIAATAAADRERSALQVEQRE